MNGNSTGSGGSGGTSSFGNGISGSPGSGGGIFSGGTPGLGHTIVAGNTAASGGTGPDLRGSFTSNGYNLIGVIDGSSGPTNGVNGDQAGTLALPLDAKLGALANNGGPTQTLPLLAGSPAIDAGDPNFNPNSFNPPLTTDQRGFSRIVIGKAGTSAATVDIGAFESDLTQLPTLSMVGSVQYQGRTMSVDFSLPEPALAGSVMLTFDNGSASQTFTLVNSFAAAGAHSLSFDPDAPLASGHFTSAAALPDGTFTVTLSYQDALGNAVATSSGVMNVGVSSAPPPASVDSLVADFTGGFVIGSAQQPDGKTIIIGTFTSVNGVTRNNVARLNADGTLDSGFDPNANGRVNAVAVQADGKIVLGGFFTALQPNGAAASTPRNYIARVNADGTLDTSFDLQVDNFVYGLAAQTNGKLLLWGVFSSVLGTTRHNVARLSADGTLDLGFDPNPNDFVFGAAVQGDGKVLLGGGFTSLDPNAAGAPVSRRCLARVNDNGSVDMGFDPSPNVRVFAIRQQPDEKVLLSGDFDYLEPNGGPSITRHRIARVNANGTLDTGFNPDAPDFETNSVALQADGGVVFTGGFVTVQGTTRRYVARVAADGTLDASFDPNLNNYALGVTLQDDGKVQLGGGFTSLQPNGAASPTARSFFARLVNDPATQTLTAPDATQVLWQRGGSATEVSGVTFEKSLDGGATWTPLGIGTRVGTTANWQLTSLSLGGQSGKLRVRGFTAGGYFNGSSGLIEQMSDFNFTAGFTATPTLTEPAMNSATKSPVTVVFTLPEAALAGSVKLQFEQIAGSFTRTLTLATSQESAGTHTFTLDPANAVASSAVASISPAAATLPDDSYNVTLSYQDAAGNPVSMATNATVKIDTSTQAPTLTKPAASAVSPNPMEVQFTLPEAPLAGSVKLKFDDGTNVRTLHLTDVVAPFSFDVGDPAASANVTSVDGGETIPDGTYTVTLSYQDELGNVAGSAQKTGVVVDGTAPQISVPAATRRAFAGTLADYTSLAQVTDATATTVSQSPAIGSTTTHGILAITLTATDAAGNDASTTFDLDVRPLAPVSTVLSATCEPVPNQGVGGIPAGAKFGTFFTPALSDLRDVAARVTVLSGTKRLNAIYQEDDGGAGKIVALQGATGPTAPGPIGLTATWKSFSDPVLAPNGTIAFLGKISGKGVPTTGDEALWSNVLTTQLVPLLQEGVEVENINGGGTKVKKIISISARDHEIIALVKLGGAAKSLDSTALFRLVLNGNSAYYYTATPLLRTGYTPAGLGAKVLSISAFMPVFGSAGQGRTHADGGIAARVKTDTKGDVLVFVDDDGTVHPLLSTVGVDAGLGAQATKLSLPATAGSGVAAKITAKFPSSTKPTDAIVFSTTISPFTHSLAVGATIPGGGATFTKLSDPVVNDTPSAVFRATISTKQTALYEWASDYTLREIVRSGAPATDANGAMIADTTFKAFTNYALPDGNGVVFIATLAGKAVKPTTAQGLWAEDDAHKLRLLLRTGQTVNGKTLKAFKLLDALPGSFGSRRSYNAAKSVAVLATFTDKTTAIVTTEVP